MFSFTPGPSLCSNEGVVTMVGGDSLVGIGKDATMSAGSCAGGSGGALHLASGRTIDGSTLLFGGRWDQIDEEMLVLPPIIVTLQPLC